MKKISRNQIINIIIGLFVALVLGIVFIPMIELSADAIANETTLFKLVDWFTSLKTDFVSNSAFYLLMTVLFGVLLYTRRYLKNKR